MQAIRTNSLSKSYGDHTGVENVILSVPQGSAYALVGPNGSGKSTIINVDSGAGTPPLANTTGRRGFHSLPKR